ncbi:uncharacterized protein [Anabrus simplex]|uniref:uncharacterized protein n=1 Tax=Anabrus simplex TaxID=316456 RepID=UPI0035A3BF86
MDIPGGQVKVDKICPFAENFKYKWSKNNRGKVYKKAIWECCKLQGRVMHHIIDNWDEETCLQWAMDGFEPRRLHGERRCDGLRGVPPSIKEVIDRTNEREREAKANDETMLSGT